MRDNNVSIVQFDKKKYERRNSGSILRKIGVENRFLRPAGAATKNHLFYIRAFLTTTTLSFIFCEYRSANFVVFERFLLSATPPIVTFFLPPVESYSHISGKFKNVCEKCERRNSESDRSDSFQDIRKKIKIILRNCEMRSPLTV